MPLRTTDTMTFSMILLKTFPTPMGLKPGFLLCGMIRQARNPSSEVDISSVQSFLVTLARSESSESDSPKFFDKKIRFQLSASKPERPDLPLTFMAAFLIISASITSNLLDVFFPERLITLRFHEHLLGRDVSVWEGSMFRCSGVIFRFLYSWLAD